MEPDCLVTFVKKDANTSEVVQTVKLSWEKYKSPNEEDHTLYFLLILFGIFIVVPIIVIVAIIAVVYEGLAIT